jgi:hypothetical protein
LDSRDEFVQLLDNDHESASAYWNQADSARFPQAG